MIPEPIDYDFLLKKDEWEMSEVRKLITSDLLYPDNIKEFSKRIFILTSSIGAKTLKPQRTARRPNDHEFEKFFRPFDIINWAIDKEIPLNKTVIDWHNQKATPKSDELPDYLNPSHLMHSKELKIAIDVWNAVLKSNPSKPKTGSRKQLIENWLTGQKHLNLTKAATDRITTMVNPDSSGGAPTTEET